MVDRGRDAADIFTATIGVGGGAKARLGPVHAGIVPFNVGAFGLRGGSWDGDFSGLTFGESDLLFLPLSDLDVPGKNGRVFAVVGYTHFDHPSWRI